MALVGRETEIGLLRRAVDDAVGGRARSVLIASEPGIGKTALAEETADAATKAGATALWGACWEGEGAPAFWPWVQIIRSYASGRPTGDLLDEMGEGAADVARLVPEVGGRFLGLTPEGDTDPEQARFRLFDHVSRFLRAAASKQPLCLVFDDLHSTGIFGWGYLHDLGRSYASYWQDYLDELAAKNMTRDAPARRN